ncbi:MAG: E3 ubiquitin protein ligase [Candidatus Heimdallarchaeota archaeon]|nr:E3 ubiquitin protein ligase [Candidatus Heimdallarchaeota archaeon]MCK5048056.1 E3 ubiquitin protein ligase [Candidatus Heimdallarchaeota archaeon]
MRGTDLFFLIVFGIIILKIVSKSRGSKSSQIARKRQRRAALRNRPTSTRTTRVPSQSIYQSRGRGTSSRQPAARQPYQSPQASSASLRQKADRALQRKEYERAKTLYIQTGHTFSAAKAVALKGDAHIQEAIDLVEYYSPDKSEEIVRNLARYFYDSNEFAKAALFLRGIGLVDEARAILTVSGTEIPEIFDSRHVSATPTSAPSQTASTFDTSTEVAPSFTETVETEEEDDDISEVAVIESGSQPLRIASSDLQDRCSVCRGPIRSGQSFVSCPHCNSSAHYSHLMEWIKVKAQCPHCRQKLRTNYFQNH